MSGPIIRKYGFPNFEQIFGKKEPQHGIEDEPTSTEPKADAAKPAESKEPKSEKTPGKS